MLRLWSAVRERLGITEETTRRLARLNHVLIPEKKEDRDQLRQRWSVRILGATFAGLQNLSSEGRLLLLLLLPVGLSALDVRYSQVHLLFFSLSTALAGSLLLRPLFDVSALSVSVSSAQRVTVGEPLVLDVELRNGGSESLHNLIVQSPFLPWDGRWQAHAPTVAELAPNRRKVVSARAVFAARGEHHLDSFGASVLVSGGLAIGRRRRTQGARFLVVPRLANVVRVELPRAETAKGIAQTTKTTLGQSELQGVRPYRIGDELKHLHAKTWARTGVPHVRQYMGEQQEQCSIAILADNALGERSQEALLSLAAGVAARLIQQGAAVDQLVLAGRSHPIVPNSGRAATDVVLDRLAIYQPLPAVSLAVILDRLMGVSQVVLLAADSEPGVRSLSGLSAPSLLDCPEKVTIGQVARALRARGVGVLAVQLQSNGGVSADGGVGVPLQQIEAGEAIFL